MAVNLRTGLLQWLVGLFCAGLGALMLVTPDQFAAPVYAALQAHLPWWGGALLLVGSAMLAITTLAATGAVRRGVHLGAGAALGGLALSFALADAWTGMVFYGVLGAATMLAGFSPPGLRPDPTRRRELLDLAAGSAAALIGGTMLLLPGQFGAKTYDLIRPALPEFGVAFLASGGLLLIAQARRASRWLLWAAHVAASATFFTYTIVLPLPQGAWTGILLYGGTGLAVLLQPWLGSRLGSGSAPVLRTRLTVALCASTTIPLVLITGLYAQHEETAIAGQVLAFHHEVASSLAHEVDGNLNTFLLAGTTVARLPGLLALEPATQATVLRRVTLVPAPLSLATFDAAGNGVARSDDSPPGRISGSSLFETVRRTQAPAFELVADPTRPDPLFEIGAPLIDSQGAMAGLVLLQFAGFPEALAHAELRPGERMYLLDPQGRAIMQAGPGALRGADLAGTPLSPQPAGAADPAGVRAYDAGGQRWLAGYAPVPSLGWRLIVERPAAVALAEVRTGRELVFGALLLAACLAAVVATVVARQLAEPLQGLVRAVQELEAGAAATPLPHTAIPELAQLATMFTAMRATLGVQTTELARLAVIVQSSDDAIMSNDLDGTLTTWNPGAERLYGYTAAEMLGQSIRRVLPPTPDDGVPPLLRRVRATGQVQHLETTQVRKDGSSIDVAVTISPIRAAGGAIIGASAIARNITDRKLADASRARLAALVQSSDDAIVGKTLAGIITSWNPAAERLYGYSAAEMVGQPLTRLVPPELPELPTILARLAHGERIERFETTRLHQTGQRLAVAVTISPIRDETGAVVGAVAITRDVTAQRQVEAQLRASQQQLEEAARVTHLGHWSWDLATNQLTWSDELARVYGVEPRAGPFDIAEALTPIHPDDQAMVDQAIERTIREGVPWDFDTRIVRPDGSTAVVQSKGVRQLDAAGTPVRLVGTAQDISERKAAEVALHQNEERLRLAFGAGGLGIWECDLVTNQVYLSPEVEAQFGIAPGTFAGTLDALLERVHVDDRARFGQALAKSMANGHDLVLEFRSIATDGTVGWLAGQAQLFRDATGRPVRLLGICRDVSERKAAEAVLRKTEVQLQQAQKMEAVGMLAGGIAHDFNNLLTAIIGFSELALGDLPEDSSVRPMIGEVTRAGERASVLTRQLLAFSRQQVMQPAVLDLNAVASDMERMLTRVIGEDIDLATVKAGDLGHVFIDPSQVEQIIMNLAVNARDAMPSGGKLTIMTANVNVFPDASVASELPAGRYVLLAVSDTGNGMDAATQARIFEPFFTTKELGKGTGLGLATVYGIVKQNESEIRVYSEPGQGTTFKVYFPRMVEEASGPHNVEETVFELACGGTETILLVEDEAVVRALALQVLESAGYTVLVAMTGEAGADIVAEYAGSIDLLLTDVVMPGGGGVELARRITEIRPRTHVLFMSGYPGEIAVRHGMLALADAYLGKPFTPHALRQKVRDVLDGAPAARELAAAPLF